MGIAYYVYRESDFKLVRLEYDLNDLSLKNWLSKDVSAKSAYRPIHINWIGVEKIADPESTQKYQHFVSIIDNDGYLFLNDSQCQDCDLFYFDQSYQKKWTSIQQDYVYFTAKQSVAMIVTSQGLLFLYNFNKACNFSSIGLSPDETDNCTIASQYKLDGIQNI